jgi:UDPglucose--hexose-1-phosphate uridylyltransferase
MRKERLVMPDGRYIIYYTFGDQRAEDEGTPGELDEGAKREAKEEKRGMQLMLALSPLVGGASLSQPPGVPGQVRWDPLLREWVTYTPQRQDRIFLPPAEWCPLCPTKEGGFPTEIARTSYELVIFENRFPSFTLHAPPPVEHGSTLTPTAPNRGVCEVVVYSENHTSTLAQMDEQRIRELVKVWIDRYRELGALEEVKYVFIFENKGQAIGVTLHHPHGQIYGYPFIPPRPAKALLSAREYRGTHDGGCLYCAVLAQEQRDGRRMVVEGEHFTAFVPFFAHYPYELHLSAKRCVPSIADLEPAEQWDLAHVLKQVLISYDALWNFSLPFMMVMFQAPTNGDNYEGVAHFRIEFYPLNRTSEKLKYMAGSESGAGAFIVDVMPEEAAEQLRVGHERTRVSAAGGNQEATRTEQ